MPINEIFQKRNLLSKIGLGVPQMSSNIRVSQQNPPNQPKPQTPTSPKTKPAQPAQPAQPSQPTQKPGCGGCRRKRPG